MAAPSPTPTATPMAAPSPTPTATPVATPTPTPVPVMATPEPSLAPVATPEPTACADLDGGCTPWDSRRLDREGNAEGYITFWDGGPRTVCSFATTAFGVLGDEHHAAARAAVEAWNDAVGGAPALFEYRPGCPDEFDTEFGEQVWRCSESHGPWTIHPHIEYIPIVWVAAGGSCAAVEGTHNATSLYPGWKAAAIISSAANAADYTDAITHELGHILYLDHTCNEHSIMHARSRCPTRHVPSGIIPADYLQIRATLGRD